METSTAVREAGERLEAGELVIHPTESVYGIGGLLKEEPIRRLRTIKDRPSAGFVVLVPSADYASSLLGDVGLALAAAFWPGALTLVVPDPDDVLHPAAKEGDGSVAIRMPGHRTTLQLLERVGQPMTSSSANLPGKAPASTLAQAEATGRRLAGGLFTLDGGDLPGAPPSTIVSLLTFPPTVLRDGRIPAADLMAALGSPAPQR